MIQNFFLILLSYVIFVGGSGGENLLKSRVSPFTALKLVKYPVDDLNGGSLHSITPPIIISKPRSISHQGSPRSASIVGSPLLWSEEQYEAKFGRKPKGTDYFDNPLNQYYSSEVDYSSDGYSSR